MLRKYFLLLSLFLGLCPCSKIQIAAQENEPRIRVFVNMVQLNVAVTDSKGNYITGLRPQDFAITEDNIPEKIAMFSEGNESAARPVGMDVADQSGDKVAKPGVASSMKKRKLNFAKGESIS